ncbi:DUF4269 domain-containing protein [Azospirillum brasilense]|nr:DUF4269 domain-containing protein [Azospirillum brasilense]NUB36138.1 DUF4269 domain-containing protein [Azospirillum brasilense]RIV97749.1 DUF4269 domain-containing protein [Azospirillum brasilense]
MKPRYEDAVERAGVIKLLAAFGPHIAGTPPLGIDVPTSDIDVLSHASRPVEFTTALWSSFSTGEEFRIHQWLGRDRAVIASFSAHGWGFGIFGQNRPVAERAGVPGGGATDARARVEDGTHLCKPSRPEGRSVPRCSISMPGRPAGSACCQRRRGSHRRYDAPRPAEGGEHR